MGPEQIGNLLLGLLVAVSTGAGLLSTNQRKARHRARVQRRDLESATDYIMKVRLGHRLHNDEQHPDGRGAITVPPLPDYLNRDDDGD